jgi:hypothetical protein
VVIFISFDRDSKAAQEKVLTQRLRERDGGGAGKKSVSPCLQVQQRQQALHILAWTESRNVF